MGSSDNRIKSIKVSDQVHEELSIRKYQDETFDDVLKRELNLVPQSISELTTVLPDKLSLAANLIVENYIEPGERYRKIGDKEEDRLRLQYVSRETNKVIYEFVVSLPGSDRVNYGVDINYRNPTNEMETIARFRDIEEDSVNIEEYKDSETHKKPGNTRRGEDAGENTASLIGPHAAEFIDQAYHQWGTSSEETQ